MRWWCVLVCCLSVLSVMDAKRLENKGLKKERELLEITGNQFVANDKTKTAVIQGNVQIKKGKDKLFANKVIVFLNDKRKPERYEAIGNTRFNIFTEDHREISGSADKLIYNALNGEYKLLQNAVVREVGKSNVITGDEIILNKTKGYADVLGSAKRPAKFVFDMEEINEENRKAKQKKKDDKTKP
ncbi:lipopolysaccharide transport periplasmic protein LptA [Helicobacter pylori]|uniref:lipopolysaccharide transport periplasmic protein LptA n=1 Tax=Helicobacter pylori TaxID=210 RepID=UPI00165C01E5|nr:lipopolysaccharide transport periplasmic protein LptA [Helicobacter pylori]WQS05039.1 lipopolysaccharide transport periplasmic protein LptA [Helicobacter pylori]WQS20878.1 lipopolysaccharide transport periplasmic protein LptA [Helicobacter pylori]WQS28887.1 lipopolysaccharide transport periplasmic protein LptA [Helicobacter pylori]WQS30220.1 lipopolysaccharide transport periplasmic protein LptA [Helicobacter pylori]